MACLPLLLACKSIFDPGQDHSRLLYSDPFEYEYDLWGWEGLSAANFRNDTPYSYSRRSVFISGGCIAPHASFVLKPRRRNATVFIQCFGKNMSNGGVVELHPGNDLTHYITISVTENSWKEYRSEETLFWPAGSSLTIWLISGGIIPSAMLIDDLKIVEIL